MPITSSEVQFHFSTKQGVSGNSGTGSGAGSLGKYITTNQLTSGLLHDLFDVVTGDENASSGIIDYRCIFIANRTVTSGLVMISPVVWLQTEVSGYAYTQIARDITLPSSINSATAQADQITNEQTAPTLIGSWNSGTTKTGATSGLSLPDIPSGYCQAIWIRRGTSNSSAVNNDGSSYVISFDSQA